jgi:CheY-like chemotaxis protein
MATEEVLAGDAPGNDRSPRHRGAWEAHFDSLLLSRELLTSGDLDAAIACAAQTGLALADAVVALGFVSEDESYETLAAVTGLALADVSALTPQVPALGLVPERVARRHTLLPLAEDDQFLTYAISEPFDDDAAQEVTALSGRTPRAVLAARSRILIALDECYRDTADDALHNSIGRGTVDRARVSETIADARHRMKPRVLIADDDGPTRTFVRFLLERGDFEVLEAENGNQAVDIARRERPDLLVLDLMMPGTDGYEAIDRIRGDRSCGSPSILVLTGQDGPDIERRLLERGADDCMNKPFDPDVLLARVSALVRRRERAAVA